MIYKRSKVNKLIKEIGKAGRKVSVKVKVIVKLKVNLLIRNLKQ
jgi:hypothetical protein